MGSIADRIKGILQHRKVRFFIVPLTIFFTASWYSGWQYLFQLLVDSGAMSWLCEECNPSHPGWNEKNKSCLSTDGYALCTAQDNQLQNLYTVMSSSEFTGNFIAGLLYDMVGYRISLIIGYSLYLFGIFSVTQSSRQIQLYWPGAVAAGLAVNIVTYPGYFLRFFFPGKEAALVTINSAASWATSAIMYLIYTGTQNGLLPFKSAIVVFVACGLPFVVMYYICLPRNRVELNKQLLAQGFAVHKQPEKTKFRDILKPFKSWEIPVFAWLIYTPLVMASNAYLTTLVNIAGRDVSLMVGNVQAFEFLMTLGYAVIGLWFTKYQWTLWLSMFYVVFTIALGLLALFTAPDNYPLQVTAGVIFITGNAFLYATKYIFSQMVIDDMLFGSIAGIIGTSSGLIDLTNVIWRSLAVDTLDVYVEVYFGVVLVSAALLVVVVIRISRGSLGHLKFVSTKRELVNKVGTEEYEEDDSTEDSQLCSKYYYYYSMDESRSNQGGPNARNENYTP